MHEFPHPQSLPSEEGKPVSFRSPLPRLVPIFLVFALLMVVVVRVRMTGFPLERDEGEYAYAGQLILEGIPPYKLVCNMKLPGTYLAYAGLMSIFGQTAEGIHFGLLVVDLASMLVLFALARKLLDLDGAVIAAAAFGLMTLSPAFLGFAAHATHFVLLPALLATWMLLRVEKSGRLSGSLVCGCLFGIAFVMKQPGVFFGIFGGLYLGWSSIAGRVAWPRVLALLGVYSLGCLAPFLAVCAWLKMAGVFPQFWFWTFSYAREYAAITSLHQGFEFAEYTFARIFKADPLVWIIAALGFACLWVTGQAWRTRIFLTGFLGFSFLSVCPGLYFRGHYFVLLVPAVALLAGFAVTRAGEWLKEKNTAPRVRGLPFLLAAIACLLGLYMDRAVFFLLTPSEASRKVYGICPFPEAVEIARYIELHSTPDQRIAVIGSEPEIYFYAHRHSSSGQIYMYPLMEEQPFARRMQKDMIRDIGRNPPEYLVFVAISYSWNASPKSSREVLDWMSDYVKGMQLVGIIQFVRPAPVSVWGPRAAETRLDSNDFITVYKRIKPS